MDFAPLRRIALAAVSLITATPAFADDQRTWTDLQGREVKAAFGGLIEGSVLLLLPDGREIPFPLEKLIAADQTFAKAQPPPLSSSTPKDWPEKVEVSSRDIEIAATQEDVASRHCVYVSAAFQFTAQDKLAGSVMKEIARTFEATRALINTLPWGIVCAPPAEMERYQAALYETREDYFRNGGPENSGGVYDSGDKIFKIPFPSLGLEKRGKTWFKNENYKNDTLIHELTHQMMHDYLPFLPKWVIEGSAEYTESIPYNAGTFRVSSHKSGIKEHMDAMTARQIPLSIPDLHAHFNMTRQQWDDQSTSSASQASLYLRSVLLVYFFNHLDGAGDGRRFIAYMNAVRSQVQERSDFFALPEVKQMPGGRFSYPSNLTPPDLDPNTAPFRHLSILLDGRTYSQLAQEMTAAYKSIGVTVAVQPGESSGD